MSIPSLPAKIETKSFDNKGRKASQIAGSCFFDELFPQFGGNINRSSHYLIMIDMHVHMHVNRIARLPVCLGFFLDGPATGAAGQSGPFGIPPGGKQALTGIVGSVCQQP